MKVKIMQKMASKYKNIQVILVSLFISVGLFGCMTGSSNQEDDNALNQALKTEESVIKSSPDIVEGLVPPTNQNILMPYYVQAGDNLLKIGNKIYGDKSSWKKIAELNNLVDPNKIYAGDVIYYQVTDKSKIFAESYENAPKAKIIVKRGDTLSQISKAVFGRTKDWRVLWKENPQIVNPDKIREGTAIYFRPKALTAKAGALYGVTKEITSPVAEKDKKSTNKDKRNLFMLVFFTKLIYFYLRITIWNRIWIR
jgi:LysM repeat protein